MVQDRNGFKKKEKWKIVHAHANETELFFDDPGCKFIKEKETFSGQSFGWKNEAQQICREASIRKSEKDKM